MKILLISLTALALTAGLRGGDLIRHDFADGKTHDWELQPGRGGELTADSAAGQLVLKATLNNGRYSARLIRLCDSAEFNGQTYELTASVSGSGTAVANSLIFFRDSRGNSDACTVSGKPLQLTENWQELKCIIALADMDRVFRLGIFLDLNGKGSILKIRNIAIREVSSDRAGSTPVRLNPAIPELNGKTRLFFSRFDNNTENWVTQPYWGGVLTRNPEGFLQLAASVNRGRNFGRIVRMTYDDTGFTGGIFELSGRFRGRGKVRVGTIVYRKDAAGKNRYSYIWSPEHPLSGEWQKLIFQLNFSKLAPQHLGLVIEVDAGGTADIDNVVFSRLYRQDLKITPKQPLTAVRQGDKTPDIEFTISDPMVQATAFPASAAASPEGFSVENRNGQIRIPGSRAGDNGRVTAAADGVTAAAVIDRFPASDYDRFDATAQRVKIEKPLNVLIIGDSLLDENFVFNRGIGVVPKLRYWLNKYHPGKVKISNRAVRGDYLERVWERLNGNGNIYAYEAYDEIYRQPAELIMILLGHNDTRTTNESGFTVPETTVEKERKYCRLMLEKFRSVWPQAKIVLVSSTCGNAELTKRNRDAEMKKGPKETVYYFNSSELMKTYNTTLKQLAAEFKADYYDIYDVMNAMPQADKDRIFNKNDGVHLTPDGQRVLALLLLEYFTK